MNQNALNRAVARATGETVDRIAQLGFSLVTVPDYSRPTRRTRVCQRWIPRRNNLVRPLTIPQAATVA